LFFTADAAFVLLVLQFTSAPPDDSLLFALLALVPVVLPPPFTRISAADAADVAIPPVASAPRHTSNIIMRFTM
jgi:hypothetical protein